MKIKRVFIAVIPFLVLTAILAAARIPALTVTRQQDGKVVYISTIKYGERFAVEWMHSVELQPWREIFEYTEQGLYLRDTRFKSFGAGVPDYGGREYALENGFIVFKGLDIKMQRVPYGVSSFAGHRLIFRHRTIPLISLTEDGTYVYIQVEKTSIINLICKKVMLWLR